MKTFEQVVQENPNFEWKNISERDRVYVFPIEQEEPYEIEFFNGETLATKYMTIVIDDTVALHVSESGGHRIIDAKGNGWYIPPKWIGIFWTVNDGTESMRF